jgi:translation elongation factor P/translation initiation factor 5A
MVDAPIVKRVEYTLLNIDDEQLELLSAQGEMKSDVNIPSEDHLKDVADMIKRVFEEGKKECLITVLATMGKELVIECREGQEV